MNKITSIILSLVFLSFNYFSQITALDSIKKELKSNMHDTTRCRVLYSLHTLEIDNFIFTNTCEKIITICNKKLVSEPKGTALHKFYTKYLALGLIGSGLSSYNSGNQTEAFSLFEKGLQLAQSINDIDGITAAYNSMGTVYNSNGDNEKAIAYFQKGLVLQEKAGNKKFAADLMANISDAYEISDPKKAEEYLEKALKYRLMINDLSGIASCYLFYGELTRNRGEILKSIDYYNKALKIFEKINNTGTAAEVLTNLGGTYMLQGDNDKGIEYFKRAQKYFEANSDTFGIATGLNNIGTIYYTKKNYAVAEDYYNKSLKIREKINDKNGIAYSYAALCAVNIQYQKYGIAEDYGKKALQLATEINDYALQATANTKLSIIYLTQNRVNEALVFGQAAFDVSQKHKFPAYIRDAARQLHLIYLKKNDPAKALETYTLYVQMKDSISNKNTRTASLRSQVNYEYEKKEAILVEKQEREQAIAAEKAQQQKIIIWSIVSGLTLTLFFAIVIFNRLKLTRKQKQIIEYQKHEVEEKHKEITDSINYAERIQRSFLATEELLKENLKEHFVFFQPKDIVSGDFYWGSKLSNNHFALVTADSTGHGVPGAIMSLLNVTSIESAIKEGYTSPSDILNATRKTIIERLKKDGSKEGGKDGMDASLISFDFENNKFIYAAANNPVWVIRNNQLIELKPDKIPIGKHDKDSESFTQHEFDLQKNDVVYALTDGLPDQFGGPKGKKFMYKQLKELLITISSESMQTQKELIAKALNNWQGNNEQVDDITIIGVKV